MKERGAVLTRGACANQARMFLQHAPQSGRIARDDSCDSLLVGGYRRACLRQRLEMRDELRPAEKAVSPRNHELRIRQRARRPGSARERARGELLDTVGLSVDLLLVSQQRSGCVLESGEPIDPLHRPTANS